MTDFFDDAIADFDRDIERVVHTLRASNQLDRTILVIYSDHGSGYKAMARVPLLIRFPQGRHSGRMNENVQNTDIAPTVLDALGIARPQWMTGSSLLQPIDPCRLLSTFSAAPTLIGGGAAPLFSLGQVGVIRCNDIYDFDVHDGAGSKLNVITNQRACDCPRLEQLDAALTARRILASRGKSIPPAVLSRMAWKPRLRRADVAPLLVQAIHGDNFKPTPPQSSPFVDVPGGTVLSGWIDQLVKDGITRGCTPTHFCPDAAVDRAQLAVMYGRAVRVPEAKGATRFSDLPGYEAVGGYIARAVADGAVTPCAPDRFCPSSPVNFDDLIRAADTLRTAQ